MRRTRLERRTPLRARPKPREDTRPPAAPLNLAAAAVALAHAAASARTERTYAGPVPDPVKPPPTGDGSFPPAVRRQVFDRDQGRCASCGREFTWDGGGWSIQHRIARKQGGTTHPRIAAVENGLLLCGDGVQGCHGWVEHHPTAAEELGFAVPSWADAATVPVCTPVRGWVLLTADGEVIAVQPPPGGNALNAAVRYQERP